jgi:hypothetical protein
MKMSSKVYEQRIVAYWIVTGVSKRSPGYILSSIMKKAIVIYSEMLLTIYQNNEFLLLEACRHSRKLNHF